MIRLPGAASRGARSNSLAEAIDLYPTLVEACQPAFRQTHHPLDGRSLLPIVRDPTATVRDTATSYWGDAVSIRTPMHRLVARKKSGDAPPSDVELYQFGGDDQENGRFDPAAPPLEKPDPELLKELLSQLP